MSDSESIRRVMEEVGPRDDEIFAVLQTGDKSWAVRFEHVDIEIELDADSERLMLSAEIGVPPEERRLSVYETLLIYNLLWSDTGGVRMALTEAGGSIVQMVDLHCSVVTTELIAIVTHNLNERSLAWREFFEVDDGGEGPAPASFDHTMIQV